MSTEEEKRLLTVKRFEQNTRIGLFFKMKLSFLLLFTFFLSCATALKQILWHVVYKRDSLKDGGKVGRRKGTRKGGTKGIEEEGRNGRGVN